MKYLLITCCLIMAVSAKSDSKSPLNTPVDMTGNKVAPQEEADFSHVVLFWLKSPDNQTDRDRFISSLEKFINQSVYIQSKHLGEPATTDRSVIDRSYTYIMILTFASKEDQDNYQEEAAHKIFISESESLWEKVVVYDSENLW